MLPYLLTTILLADPMPADSVPQTEQAELRRLTAELVEGHSQRGDILFRTGRFADAVTDYEAMITLDPSRGASHWRLGIAYYYAGQFAKSARQFDRYHTFDQVDRENGIWRYLAQVQSLGEKKARENLLGYRVTDRPPLNRVYDLFAGKIDAATLLREVETAKLPDAQRQQRLFYVRLYLGLHADALGKTDAAVDHLRKAADNPWPKTAGYGPRYMSDVARLHRDRLLKKKSGDASDAIETPSP